MYKILISTFNAFIDRTAPLYLCELIEQQTSKTNTRLAGDAFLLKLPPPSRNCADTFFERFFLYGAENYQQYHYLSNDHVFGLQ